MPGATGASEFGCLVCSRDAQATPLGPLSAHRAGRSLERLRLDRNGQYEHHRELRARTRECAGHHEPSDHEHRAERHLYGGAAHDTAPAPKGTETKPGTGAGANSERRRKATEKHAATTKPSTKATTQTVPPGKQYPKYMRRQFLTRCTALETSAASCECLLAKFELSPVEKLESAAELVVAIEDAQARQSTAGQNPAAVHRMQVHMRRHVLIPPG